jgi:tetratricopeptide (TPR) repeat protein
MKNVFFSLFLLISIQSFAQLTFDKTILDSEDKWVVFPQDSSNGLYRYGFIYVDPQAGLIFDYNGSLKIDANEKIIAYPKEENSSMKIPLNPNKVLIALIPEANFEQLKISKVPNWLNDYKMEEGSIERLYTWGTIYNAWGEYQKALVLLEKAAKINSEYKGLHVQLAYSYNRLKEYKKAIEVLQKALIVNPTDAFVHKEYIYALAKSQQLDAAIASYRNALKVCPDETYVPENAYYILEGYFYKYDRVNFDKWLAETEVVMSSNEQIKKIIGEMKVEITKNRL